MRQRLCAPGGDDEADSLIRERLGDRATETFGRRCDHSDPSLETEFHEATSLSLPAGGRRGRL
jgi:hypothetical protein